MRSLVVAFLFTSSVALLGTVSETTRASTHVHHEHHSVEKLRKLALRAYERDDFDTFARYMARVADRSGEAVDVYNLACGLALTGRGGEALEILTELAERETGLFELLIQDDDFASLRGRPEFRELIARSAFIEQIDDQLEPLRERALDAYRKGSYTYFARTMEVVVRYSMRDRDRYNLACGYALTGRSDEALDLLETLAERNVDYGAAHDEDFASLRDDPRFVALLRRH